MVLGVQENNTLRQPCGATGVEDIGHVAEFGLIHTALHFALVGIVALPQRQKLIKAQREAVVLVALHLGIEDHDVF